MSNPYTYSKLNTEQLYETLELVRNVFMEFEAPDYSPEGIEEFLRFLDPVEITNMLDDEKMQIWVCVHDWSDCNGGSCGSNESEKKIVGMIAGNHNHINLLFVDGKHHRKGIARRLLEILIENFNPTELTVNSSPFALEAYRRLGFKETAPEKIENGIRFTPMKWGIQK